MNRSQRIARINALISRPQGASLAQLMEELEVSRATVEPRPGEHCATE